MTRAAPPGVEAMLLDFDRAAHSVFRLETLQVYRGSGEEEAITAFQAGRPVLEDDEEHRWYARMLADAAARGCRNSRVHLVIEPLTDYLRFELLGAYPFNVAHGEHVGILPIPHQEWPAELPQQDFWLFDSARLYDLHYGDDGTWLGAELTTDPARVLDACRWREIALHRAIPWQQYVHSAPGTAAVPAARGST